MKVFGITLLFWLVLLAPCSFSYTISELPASPGSTEAPTQAVMATLSLLSTATPTIAPTETSAILFTPTLTQATTQAAEIAQVATVATVTTQSATLTSFPTITQSATVTESATPTYSATATSVPIATPTLTSTATNPVVPADQSTPTPTATVQLANLDQACLLTVNQGIDCLNDQGIWQKIAPEASGLRQIERLTQCPNGMLWALGNGLGNLGDATWQLVPGEEIPFWFACDRQSRVWTIEGDELKVRRWDDQSWQEMSTFANTAPNTNVEQIQGFIIDGAGLPWVILESQIYHFPGERWRSFNKDDWSLNVRRFAGVTLDAQGELWVGSDRGLIHFDGEKWRSHPFDIGEQLLFDADEAASTLHLRFDTQQRLWIATGQGVWTYDDTTWRAIDTPITAHITSLDIDRRGRVWLATQWGLSIREGEEWTTWTMANSELSDNALHAVVVNGAGPTLPELLEKQTGAIRGKVTFKGDPLSTVTVELCGRLDAVREPAIESPCVGQPATMTTTTDKRGTFQVEDVAPGYYRLYVQTPTGWRELTDGLGMRLGVTLIQSGEVKELKTAKLRTK